MHCSTPDFPVLHHLPECAQTHVHLILYRLLLLLPSVFPALESFAVSPLFASGGQSLGTSASASVFPLNIQDWFPLALTGWIFLQSKGLSRVFFNTVQKHQFFGTQLSFIVQLSHPHMTIGKTIALTRQTFVGKVMSLPFNMLFRLVITFLPRSKCLLISWLQSPSTVILKPNKIRQLLILMQIYPSSPLWSAVPSKECWEG